jgi:hypothetical protein
MKPLALICCLMVGVAVNAAEITPAFEAYQVQTPLICPRLVDTSTNPLAHRFRTVLRHAADKGQNFAGKCAIAKWGCGTDCIEWAIIDLETGKVFFDQHHFDLMWIVGWETGVDDGYLIFRPNSTLLIAQGATNEHPKKVYRDFLRWTGNGLELLKSEVIYEDKNSVSAATPSQAMLPDRR